MDAAEVNPVPQTQLERMYVEEDYEKEDREASQPRAPNPKQALFVDFAEREDAPPLMTAQQKKIKEIEDTKQRLETKLKKKKDAKGESDDEEDYGPAGEYAVRPPYVKQEISEHQQVKE